MNIIEQNILEVTGDFVICHQVNCKGVMGGGLALQIRNKWPHVYDTYLAKTDWRLHDCQIVEITGWSPGDIDNSQYVANLAGQHDHDSSVPQTDTIALEDALRVARDFADANGLTLYIPYMMGCGLAGGDWEKVSTIIERTAPNAVVCRYVP